MGSIHKLEKVVRHILFVCMSINQCHRNERVYNELAAQNYSAGRMAKISNLQKWLNMGNTNAYICVQMASYWFVEVSVYFNVFNYVVLFSNIILMFQPRTSMFQQCLLTDTITIQRNFTIRIFFYFSRFEHRNSHLCSIFGNPFSLLNTTNSFQAFSTFVKNGKLIIAPTKTAAPTITEHTTTGITNAGNVRTIDTHTRTH